MFEIGKAGFFIAITALIILIIIIVPSDIAAAEPPATEKINVFAALSGEIETACREAATTLKNEEGLESFPIKGYQVHCTLYMTQYPLGSLEKVASVVAELAAGTSEFDIQTTGLEITSGSWFFMNLDRNPNLQTFSDAVVVKLAPLRHPSNFVPDWAKDNPTKVEYITKYGSPNVYAEFNPHLTLLAKSDEARLKRFLEKHTTESFTKPVSGRVVAIGLGIADRDGQIKEPFKLFPLQPQAKK